MSAFHLFQPIPSALQKCRNQLANVHRMLATGVNTSLAFAAKVIIGRPVIPDDIRSGRISFAVPMEMPEIAALVLVKAATILSHQKPPLNCPFTGAFYRPSPTRDRTLKSA